MGGLTAGVGIISEPGQEGFGGGINQGVSHHLKKTGREQRDEVNTDRCNNCGEE